MKVFKPETQNRNYRIAVGTFFFISGITFASWASRIPFIKAKLGLSEGEMGSVLFCLPIGSFTGLTFSGWLVTHFGSRKMLRIAAILYTTILILIGLVAHTWQLAILLFFFGIAGNIFNISVNTQAVGVESLYNGRTIMSSFHGLWSFAGFSGALIGTLMVALNATPLVHFICIAIGCSLLIVGTYRHTYPMENDANTKKKLFVKPDAIIIKLGVIAFGNMACEGTMFDWSGIYFQKVVHAPLQWITLGYLAFMATMATGRFLGDTLIMRFGTKRMLQGSGLVIATGLLTAVFFPTIYIATISFLMVGFGVSTVVPLVYSTAGKTSSLPPNLAIASLASIGFLGFLVGPPLIGYIAQAANLRVSFAVIAMFGLSTALLATTVKLNSKSVDSIP